MSGKGSGRRPTDEKKYQNNYEKIFGKKNKEQKEKEQDELRNKAEEPNSR